MLWLLIVGTTISLVGAFFTFREKATDNKVVGKSNQNNLRNTILICSGIGVSFISGLISEHDGKVAGRKSDSLEIIADGREREIIHLQKQQIDTTAKLLESSLSSNLLQERIGDLQNQLYSEVTGGDSIVKVFNISIIVDSNYSPVGFADNNVKSRGPFLAFRNSDIQSIAFAVLSAQKRPKSFLEAGSFYIELLKFKLLKDIISFHSHPSVSWAYNRIHTEIYIPPNSLHYSRVTYAEIRSTFSGSIFSVDLKPQDSTEFSHTRLPEGLRIVFGKKDISLLSKSGEFNGEIKIGPVVSFGPGKLPEMIDLPFSELSHYQTLVASVILKANIVGHDEHVKSNDRKWINWVFSQLERIDSD